MSRHDLANLVFRVCALWLGVTGITTLASLPWLAWVPDLPARLFTVVVLIAPFPTGLALWYVAPRLAGAVFDRSGEAVPYTITPESVPPLASFVVGLVVAASAVPNAVSWLVMQVMRSRVDASLMNPDLLPAFDQRSAGVGAEVVTRLVVGAVLIAISRRPGLWSTPADEASPEE
jgi:hypothetical protein